MSSKYLLSSEFGEASCLWESDVNVYLFGGAMHVKNDHAVCLLALVLLLWSLEHKIKLIFSNILCHSLFL